MSPLRSASWGLAGGLAVEVLELAAEIRRNKGRWPWTGKKLWPSLLAVVLRLAGATLVAAALGDQIAGHWPAFCLGASAPVVLSRIMEQVPPIRPGTEGTGP